MDVIDRIKGRRSLVRCPFFVYYDGMNIYDEFEKKIEERQVDLHGYILFKDGEIKKEYYKEPFDENFQHRAYSVAKSLTALGIGLLEKDGKLSLKDTVCGYFPEYEPEEGFHPWMKEMTIEDCLTMQTCHSKTTYRIFEDKDWVETFFKVKPDHRPGCVFAYDTSAALVLCALCEKITGQEMLDFLRDRFLDKIGFSKEAHMQKEPGGYSQGGSGLVCTTRDLFYIGKLLLDKGSYNGEELIPEVFIKKATSKITATSLQGNLDERFGYGYFIWKTRKEGFALYGMGGQLSLVFPDKNMVFACTADTQVSDGLSHLYDAFYDCIYDKI